MKYYVTHEGLERLVEIHPSDEGLKVLVDGSPLAVDLAEVEGSSLYSLIVDGNSVAFAARFEDGHAVLSFHDRELRIQIEDERTRLARQATGAGRRGPAGADVKSVMPGVVKEIRVAEGDAVKAGDALLILEAMKMENEIRAQADGLVESVHVEAGTAVDKGALLVTLAPPPTDVPPIAAAE